jgi:hypothetical protein
MFDRFAVSKIDKLFYPRFDKLLMPFANQNNSVITPNIVSTEIKK